VLAVEYSMTLHGKTIDFPVVQAHATTTNARSNAVCK